VCVRVLLFSNSNFGVTISLACSVCFLQTCTQMHTCTHRSDAPRGGNPRKLHRYYQQHLEGGPGGPSHISRRCGPAGSTDRAAHSWNEGPGSALWAQLACPISGMGRRGTRGQTNSCLTEYRGQSSFVGTCLQVALARGLKFYYKKSGADAPDSFPFCLKGLTEGIILSLSSPIPLPLPPLPPSFLPI